MQIETKIASGDTADGMIYTTRPHNKQGFGPAFPITTRYNNLKGYYKYTPQHGDSAQVIVYITKTGYVNSQYGTNMVAWGQKELSTASTYTPFSAGYSTAANFVYMDSTTVPDSAFISLIAYKEIGATSYNLHPLGNSTLVVDALNFNTYITGIDEPKDITTGFKLFPNASNGIFDVTFSTFRKCIHNNKNL